MTAEERKVLGFREKRREAALAYLLGPGVLAVGSAFLLAGPPTLLFGLLNAIFGWVQKAFLKPFEEELEIAAIVWFVLWYGGVWGLGVVAWVRARPRRALIEQDLQRGVVSEVRHTIYACLCVSDDEHGALGYFLLTPAGVAFVWDHAPDPDYVQDDEAWEYRRLGRDPRQVAFLPQEFWIISRAPLSEHVVSTSWQGDRIEPIEGTFGISVADPWVGGEPGTLVPATWEEVVAKFAKPENLLPSPPTLCLKCEYDLTATPEDAHGTVTCPECAQPHPLHPPTQAA